MIQKPTAQFEFQRCLKAGVSYFALVFAAGFALALIRVPFLVPRFGVRAAELAEMPVMFIAILLASRFVVRRFALSRSTCERLMVGGIALLLLLCGELLLATMVQDQSIAQYIASRDPVSGSVYLAMLGVFALMPFVLAQGPPHDQGQHPSG